MKDRLTKLLTAFVIAMFMAAMIPAYAGTPSEPHNADSMWLEPSAVTLNTATVAPGYKFNITVWLNVTSANVFGYQVAMYYNRTYLKATRSDFTSEAGGPSQFFEGHSVSTAGPTIDTSFLGNGSVVATESCKGDDFIPTPHVGSLIWIEFEVLTGPSKYESLTADFDISSLTPASNWVKDPDLVPITITAYDATYAYNWSPPTTNPHMSVHFGGFFGLIPPGSPVVDPLYILYGAYANYTGSGFDADIYIESLEVGWALTNASFWLTFNTTVIDIVGGNANVTIDSLWGTSNIDLTTPGTLKIMVKDPSSTPSGDVLVATATFTVMMQRGSPPWGPSELDESYLTFSDVILYDHINVITTDASEDGHVVVPVKLALPLPWLEVVPSNLVIGETPWIGEEFDVDIKVVNLNPNWYTVGIQFRLTFDPAILELVDAEEGPFMQDPRWNLYGTFFTSWEQPPDWLFPWHHVAVGDILYPNSTGYYDQTQLPNAEGPQVDPLDPPEDPVLTTITFKVLQQNCFGGANITTYLDIVPFNWPEDHHFLDKEGGYVPTDTTSIVNGTVTIEALETVGRVIDVYGGAENRGYGTIPFPAPYGGQGPDAPMDLVIAQSVVYLFADVTYNYWPVQSKEVGFEIEGPYDHDTGEMKQTYHIRKYTNVTDSMGVAWIRFQMPWPCDNPQDYFGLYKVTVTVDICGEVVMDTLEFNYYYLVEITKVSVDRLDMTYYHDEYVEVCIEYRTKAQQDYPVLFAVVIQDELATHFGFAYEEITVGGAEFCSWSTGSVCVSIYIPKWAFAGIAKIYVSAYDKDPTIGGAPWVPTYGQGWPIGAEVPEICIMPY